MFGIRKTSDKLALNKGPSACNSNESRVLCKAGEILDEAAKKELRGLNSGRDFKNRLIIGRIPVEERI